MGSTLFTIAKDVKIQIEFNPAQVSQYRLLGYENRARARRFQQRQGGCGRYRRGPSVTAIYEMGASRRARLERSRRYESPQTTPNKARGRARLGQLRYKLPDGRTSRLIERPVAAGLMRMPRAPAETSLLPRPLPPSARGSALIACSAA